MDRFTKHLKNPFAGLSELLGRVSLPGFDATGIVDARRKDIDAVLEANRIVYAGAQALAQKQLDILRVTMGAARSAVADGSFSGTPVEIAGKQRELMTKAFQMSLAHMRELAEIVRKSQADAFAVVKGQVQEDIANLVGRVQRRGKPAPPAAAAPPAAKKARRPRGRSLVAVATVTLAPAKSAARKGVKKAAKVAKPAPAAARKRAGKKKAT